MTTGSINSYYDSLIRLKRELDTADAVLIGAGAGLSASAGFTYSGKRFEDNFSDFQEQYGFHDMYSSGFYPYDTLEEYWAFWSRNIVLNRYQPAPADVYENLLDLVKDKDYFVLTTNVDHQFQKAGFDKERLFYTQGDYGLWQCSRPCHQKTYDNETAVRRMIYEQKHMKIPPERIPRCPLCGAPMTMNLRCDGTFAEDDGWHEAARRYKDFVQNRKGMHILYLELGVGVNTPAIIKYPFWRMTYQNPKAVYVCINYGQAWAPPEIGKRSICLDEDIGEILLKLKNNF